MTKKRKRFDFGLIAAAALLLAGVEALGQPRDNPLDRARHHMDLGQEAFDKGRFDEAAEQFENAYAASPFSAFLYNGGLAYEKAGKPEKAVDLYRKYLEAEPQAPDYAQVDMKIRALLAGAEVPVPQDVTIGEVEMKSLISVRTNPPDAVVRILDAQGKEVSKIAGPQALTVVRGTYTIEASHPEYRTVQTEINVVPGHVYVVVVEMSQGAFLGFLSVKTDLPGAAVFLDNRADGQVGQTPWGNVLPTGKHRVWVEKPGYTPITQEVDIALGEQRELALALERLPFGTVLVKTNAPGSEVFLDGKPIGKAPVEQQVLPGRHKLKVTAEGLKDYETEIAVGRGQQTKLLVRLNAKPKRTSAWVSLGFSAALLATGGTLGVFALRTSDDLGADRNAGRLADNDSRILKGFLLALGADISFGVGAVVGALCIWYFLRDPLPPSEGKLFDPVDFNENPENVRYASDGAAAPAPKAGEKPGEAPAAKPAAAPEARWRPRFTVAPILGSQTAGIGMALVF